ncbi:50S ribosomal protein L18 [candidate division TM6 bacterium RIFCSPHIGHO2_12_FULL_38_8]|nr:MAG: 50S ribosomal protein L18 [candidate division TM6 bacterium RIFCSPHIGHO2_12_FULL_38_8]
MNIKKIEQRRERRAFRVRKSLRKKNLHPRVSVFRSLQNISAQLIDDVQQKTIVSSSSLALNLNTKKEKLDKTAVAKAVGLDLAKKALQAKIEVVCFDRGSYLYHGRVKALAEGLREGGLKL